MWDGIFKSYSVVKVIPLAQMTPDDWRVLEYENLRNVAKNRIAESATELVGFVLVHVFEKGIGKPYYYSPATPSTVEEIQAGNFQFLNPKDDDELVPKAILLSSGQSALASLVKTVGAGVIVKRIIEDVSIAKLVSDLNQLVDSGLEDYNDLDAALAIALELIKYEGFDYLEAFIDDADEILGWAEDKGLI